MRFTLSSEDIQNLAANRSSYHRAQDLIASGQLRGLYTVPEQQLLVAYVRDSLDQERSEMVQMRLNQSGRPQKIFCTCQQSKSGCCRHMLAAMLALKERNLDELPRWSRQCDALERQGLPQAAIQTQSFKKQGQPAPTASSGEQQSLSSLPDTSSKPSQASSAAELQAMLDALKQRVQSRDRSPELETAKSPKHSNTEQVGAQRSQPPVPGATVGGRTEPERVFRNPVERASYAFPQLMRSLRAADQRRFPPLRPEQFSSTDFWNEEERFGSAHSDPAAAFDEGDESENRPEEAESEPGLEDENQGSDALHLLPRLQLPRLTGESAQLYLRIRGGESKRAYIVRQPDIFIQRVLSGEDIFFGKSLHFYPSDQSFDPYSERLLQWLTGLYKRAVWRLPNEFSSQPLGFQKNYISLSPEQVWDFLERFSPYLKQLHCEMRQNSREDWRPLELTEGPPPLRLHLLEQPAEYPGQDYLCDFQLMQAEEGKTIQVYCPSAPHQMEGPDSLRLLTRDARLLLFRQRIYRLPSQHNSATVWACCLRLLAQDPRGAISVPRSQLFTLLNFLYPRLNQQAPYAELMDLPSVLLAQREEAPLRSLVWIEPYQRGLALHLLFRYGRYFYNPQPQVRGWYKLPEGLSAASEQDLPDLLEACPTPFVKRQIQTELQLQKLLSHYAFLTQVSGRRTPPQTERGAGTATGSRAPEALDPSQAYFLLSDERLYRFLTSGLCQLRALVGEIFMSADFRLHFSQRQLILNGQLHYNQASNLLEWKAENWPYSPEDISRILAAYRERRHYARLSDDSFLDLLDPQMQEQMEMLDRLERWKSDWTSQGLRLAPFRAISLLQLFQDQGVEIPGLSDRTETGDAEARAGEKNTSEKTAVLHLSPELQTLYQQIREPSQLDFPLPQGLQVPLRHYQAVGYRWLKSLCYYGFGGILADDMGLGKTLQALCLIASEDRPELGPSLVVAPTSLLYNWEAEARDFFPDLRCLVLDGNKKQRLEKLSQARDYQVLISSYHIIRQDAEELGQLQINVCILDEAQYIKNPNTRTSLAVKQLKARRRLALTGTPIENRLTELWSIFDFLMPGYLFSHRQFHEQLELPLVRDNAAQAQLELQRLIQPFILRRLKAEVLDELPDKILSIIPCDMTEEQAQIYYAHLARSRQEIAEETALGREDSRQMSSARRRMLLLAKLMRLRQICCHPSLFLRDYHGASGKLDSLMDLLESFQDSDRSCLIFSQFTSMLTLIRRELDRLGLPYFYIDGQVQSKERLEQAQRFNQGERRIFLVSLRAGGTGLNLIGANTVIHVDPWWNPAVEDQATDRAHRIGQERVVQVFRLVTRGSIEEKIYELQAQKRELVSRVLEAEQAQQLEDMDLADLEALFA